MGTKTSTRTGSVVFECTLIRYELEAILRRREEEVDTARQNLPGRKHRRREARLAKAAAVAPRPVDKLRPVVRCPTVKYNRRVRAGRGFTIQELKRERVVFQGGLEAYPPFYLDFQEAGIARKLAPTIGIAVDHRRVNACSESLSANVARLKEYRARLILFPRKSGQFKKLDSSAEDIKAALESKNLAKSVGSLLPIANVSRAQAVTEISKADMPEGEKAAYRKLRDARSDARYVGVREKRAKAKAEEAAAAKK
ncbi:60S ribosomal protein L13 [Emydomyces testavorans]|uniref:60S ribosomal protein L13 n=1 Tax=Emydomyces testavorans TaxID=2070801 RepID=A0AAF0DJ96_9EURO|nr:60S ribosomal protein L13 [Emydomyces testavorans]